jgi:hypothetical protein
MLRSSNHFPRLTWIPTVYASKAFWTLALSIVFIALAVLQTGTGIPHVSSKIGYQSDVMRSEQGWQQTVEARRTVVSASGRSEERKGIQVGVGCEAGDANDGHRGGVGCSAEDERGQRQPGEKRQTGHEIAQSILVAVTRETG